MDEDSFNMVLRKFLKVVGVTSQREIDSDSREHAAQSRRRRDDRPSLIGLAVWWAVSNQP